MSTDWSFYGLKIRKKDLEIRPSITTVERQVDWDLWGLVDIKGYGVNLYGKRKVFLDRLFWSKSKEDCEQYIEALFAGKQVATIDLTLYYRDAPDDIPARWGGTSKSW